MKSSDFLDRITELAAMSYFCCRSSRVLRLLAVAFAILLINLYFLSGSDSGSLYKASNNIPISQSSSLQHHGDRPSSHDRHPIMGYMKEADKAWAEYEQSRSSNFRDTIAKYRRIYGRHPPPEFDKWYKMSRDLKVHNVDDFSQIMDDLRPYWGLKPSVVRSRAALMCTSEGMSCLSIRNGELQELERKGWRAEVFSLMVGKFAKYLPDMDIPMNAQDQPRIVVPWNDMQPLLAKEKATRKIDSEAKPVWTSEQSDIFVNGQSPSENDVFWNKERNFMLLAKEACAPNSPARNTSPSLASSSKSSYKDPETGFVTNFNLSSDLCTVGQELQDKHGFLFASTTLDTSQELYPVFSECKTSVHNDIIFPANIHYVYDEHFSYNASYDYEWVDKQDIMFWRGATSGGKSNVDNWFKFHRQRLFLETNPTVVANKEKTILAENPSKQGHYENFEHFHPSKFATEHIDIGITSPMECEPDCRFYDAVIPYKGPTSTIGEQYDCKYLVDVDGHSFSGRWRAFLQSRSLGIKATIFKEWYDSRMFAWRHFVPLDNQYDDLYGILTYFIGVDERWKGDRNKIPYVPSHDREAEKLALQGNEWAAKVVRQEDIEIYVFRLLIEYARILDNNRDIIGYSADGREFDEYDNNNPFG